MAEEVVFEQWPQKKERFEVQVWTTQMQVGAEPETSTWLYFDIYDTESEAVTVAESFVDMPVRVVKRVA